jgi:hypothetical protein
MSKWIDIAVLDLIRESSPAGITSDEIHINLEARSWASHRFHYGSLWRKLFVPSHRSVLAALDRLIKANLIFKAHPEMADGSSDPPTYHRMEDL